MKEIYITVLEILTIVSGLAVGTSLSITGVGASIGVPVAGCTSYKSNVEHWLRTNSFQNAYWVIQN